MMNPFSTNRVTQFELAKQAANMAKYSDKPIIGPRDIHPNRFSAMVRCVVNGSFVEKEDIRFWWKSWRDNYNLP